MRWSSHRHSSAGVVLSACFAICSIVFVCIFIFASTPANEKKISIYSSSASYTLAVAERNGRDYVGLIEILEPLARIDLKSDGLHWKLRCKSVTAEFTAGETRARIERHEYDLASSFLVENGRGLVPIASLSILLPRLLDTPVTFHEASRRLFIGNVAVHFTAQIIRANLPTLTMNFSSPVNPMIATEPGKLRMVFTHEPLVGPGSQTLTFDSSAMPSANFNENNGAAEITVNGSAPLLASFSKDGRTITIAPAPVPTQAPPAAAPQVSNLPAAPAGSPPAAPAMTAPAQPAAQAVPYFVVVDASHGGEERGAALTDQLAEKDVTLAFARRLRQELDAHGLNTLVLRDGDATLSLDQRASLANVARPKIYICVHAASLGTGVRLYTAMLPQGGGDRGPFLDWDTAQAGFRFASQSAEASLSAEFGNRQVPVRTLIAPLRPLNNIAAAAIGIEIAPPASGISELNSTAYQQLVAEAVAAGVAAVRDKLGAAR